MSDDANPDEQTIIVNIKGVRKSAWKGAKDLADKHKEPMGDLVSRALEQLIRIDTGPREIFPERDGISPPISANLNPKSANPDSHEDAALAELLNAAAAVSAHNERQLKSVPGLTSLLAERVRAARGLPPAKPRERHGSPAPLRIAAGAGAGEGT